MSTSSIDILEEIKKNNASFEVFQSNIELLMERFPKIGFLALGFSSEYQLFQNTVGELNAKKEDSFLYPKEAIAKQITSWTKDLAVQKREVVYLYGIGLGYSYLGLKSWLDLDSKNTIVFLESEEDIFLTFLQTSLAEKILKDPQVHICFFFEKEKKDPILDELSKLFPTKNIEVIPRFGLPKKKWKSCNFLRAKLFRKSFLSDALFKDRLYSHFPFQNFVQNVQQMPHSFYTNSLKGAFKDVAAVVVGAGPSLEKEMQLLKKLENRALLLAGGSAIAALSSKGISPHIGLALDPNYEEFQRMQANISQEFPLLYSTRVHPLIFSTFNGLYGYMRSAIGGIAELWIDEELNLQGEFISEKLSQEALSVTTVGVALAKFLGCNPIILVGCDLSFSHGKRYAQGVENTPGDHLSKFEILKRKDIHGKMVQTSTHWIMESSCIADFFKKNRKIKIFNATSEGIGFPGIPNVALVELSKQYMTKQYDLRNWLFSEIQSQQLPITTKDHIQSLMQKLEDSMVRCQSLCKTMIEEYDKAKNIKEFYETGKIVLTEMDLKEEIAFSYLFYDLQICLERLFLRTFRKKNSKVEMEQKKWKWFLEKITYHLQIMRNFSNIL